MQDTESLNVILKNLSHSSMRADAIVLRLSSYSAVDLPIETVDVLNKEIAALHREINELHAIVSVLQEYSTTVEDLTDEQEANFLRSIEAVVTKLSWQDMTFGYSPQIMATYPRNLRYLVALALVNSCIQRGLQPEPFWQDLVSKQGVI